MGEIGRSQQEFLYEVNAWQLRLIIRGYYRRNREEWSMVRWQTYNLMCVSMADLKKACIYRPTDLIQFPWEKETEHHGHIPTKEEADAMRQMIIEENKRLDAEREKAAQADTIP